jgi:hypothetical protein
MEFVVVHYPTPRNVNVDGSLQGPTEQELHVQRGTHAFDLGMPLDYTPPGFTLQVKNTQTGNPLELFFQPAMAAVGAGIVITTASIGRGPTRAAGPGIRLPRPIPKRRKAAKRTKTAKTRTTAKARRATKARKTTKSRKPKGRGKK